MKCPECGLDLHKVSIVGLDDSYRCGNCGSVRIMGWVINKIADGGELKVTPMGKSGGEAVVGRSLACPEDGSWLSQPGGNDLPPDVPMWQCGKCKWWWLPGDNIFAMKKAFDVKREYNHRWKKQSPITSFALPVVLTLVLTVGLGTVVMAVRDRYFVDTKAASNVSGLMVIYQDGKAEVRFRAVGDVGMVAYKRVEDKDWLTARVFTQGDWNIMDIDGVNPGEKIWLSFGQEVKQVTVGKQQ